MKPRPASCRRRHVSFHAGSCRVANRKSGASQAGLDHHPGHVGHRVAGRPMESLSGMRWVGAATRIVVCAYEIWVVDNVLAPIEAQSTKGLCHKFFQAAREAGGDDKVFD